MKYIYSKFLGVYELSEEDTKKIDVSLLGNTPNEAKLLYFKNDFIFYNEIGNDPMSLSSININEFEEALEINRRKERIKGVYKSNENN